MPRKPNPTAKQNRKTKNRDKHTPESKAKGGRPPYQPSELDREVVRMAVAGGIQHQVIADVLTITRKTLEKHFRRELDLAKVEANTKVVSFLFKECEKGNVRALEFWLTNQDKKNWAHTQKVAVDQNVVANLGDRLTRAQEKFRKGGK